MSRYLIVNADDFGLSEAVNYGILRAFKEGIVTSTTIMANMPGYEHAIQLAKENPGLHIGVHLTLTTYKPLLKNRKHIVMENGYFHDKNKIDEIDTEEAYEELKAQIEKVLESGIEIDHLDSHHHVHAQRVLKDVMERLSKEYQLPFRGGFSYDSHIEKFSNSNIEFYDKGITVETFKKIAKNVKEGEICEIMCHPAYVDHFLYNITSYALQRIDELEILCSEEVKQILKDEDIILTTYSQIQ
ncbi:chitin disaccharide deacetylase [Amedibacillus sp. YH-ame6]